MLVIEIHLSVDSFNLIRFKSIQIKIRVFNVVFVIEIHSSVESDVLWELYNNTETRSP